MNGRVKMYNKEKGYGFISDEDGNDYFFHISQVKNAELILGYDLVEFYPTVNERGKVATNVRIVLQGNSKPTFIALGDVRIKLNNIKEYGISSEKVTVTRAVYESLFPLKDELPQIDNKGALTNLLYDLAKIGHELARANRSLYDIRSKYLYITTYQGDEYKFYDYKSTFNIFEKEKELDNHLVIKKD